jgi:hypothetical protein
MSPGLKNVLVSIGIVLVGTVVSGTLASIVALWVTTPNATTGADAIALTFALLIAVGAALLCSVVFCVVTLFMAALTLPLSLWLIRAYALPRPAADIIGGAAVAYFCVQVALEWAESLHSYGLFLGATPAIFTAIGVSAGAAMGLLRYAVFKPEARTGAALAVICG